MKKITSMILALVFAVSVIGSASAKTLKIQLTFPKTSYDGQIVKMWTDRVTKLTRGELKFELLSKGKLLFLNFEKNCENVNEYKGELVKHANKYREYELSE